MFRKKSLALLLAVVLSAGAAFPVMADVKSEDYVDTCIMFTPQIAYGTEDKTTAIDAARLVKDENDGDFRHVSLSNGTLITEEKGLKFVYSENDGWKEEQHPRVTGKFIHKALYRTASSSNEYEITMPDLKADGYILLGWARKFSWAIYDDYFINSGNLTNNGLFKPGETYQFRIPEMWGLVNQWGPDRKIGDVWNAGEFEPVVCPAQSINEKFQSVSFNEGGHSVSANINVTPAYTGSKIKAGDVIEYMEVDGKKIAADDVKVKVDKNKAIGSTVEVKIQKIKGLDKETNKLLKGKSLGTVTIRPIVAQELLTSPTKTYSKEGQVYVKAKGDKAKAAYVYVAKKGKYSSSTKVKKIKLKKGTYTYISSTPAVTFNSDLITGAAVAGR